MAKTNFKDTETGEEFFFTNFIMMGNTSGIIFKDKKTGKQLVNPKNGNILELIDNVGDIEAPLIFKSNDKATRVKMLQDRSKKHFKGEIKDRKHEMNRDLINKFEGK